MNRKLYNLNVHFQMQWSAPACWVRFKSGDTQQGHSCKICESIHILLMFRSFSSLEIFIPEWVNDKIISVAVFDGNIWKWNLKCKLGIAKQATGLNLTWRIPYVDSFENKLPRNASLHWHQQIGFKLCQLEMVDRHISQNQF